MTARDPAATVRDTLRFAQDDEAEAALDELLAALEQQAADAQKREEWFAHAVASWKAEEEDWKRDQARAVRAEEALRRTREKLLQLANGTSERYIRDDLREIAKALAAAGADTQTTESPKGR